MEATLWINSVVPVEGKDKAGDLKIENLLGPSKLEQCDNKELYHFKTPEDIVYLLADVCIIAVWDCKKGYWH